MPRGLTRKGARAALSASPASVTWACAGGTIVKSPTANLRSTLNLQPEDEVRLVRQRTRLYSSLSWRGIGGGTALRASHAAVHEASITILLLSFSLTRVPE